MLQNYYKPIIIIMLSIFLWKNVENSSTNQSNTVPSCNYLVSQILTEAITRRQHLKKGKIRNKSLVVFYTNPKKIIVHFKFS